MTAPSVLERVQQVFRKVFRNPSLVISGATTAADIPRWDSLFHITLVVAIEKEFQIRFKTGEITQFKDVGALVAAVERLASAKG